GGGNGFVVGIDEQDDGFDAVSGPGDQLFDRVKAHMARAFGEMDEPDHVRALGDDVIEDVGGFHPANLDDRGGHASSSAASRAGSSARAGARRAWSRSALSFSFSRRRRFSSRRWPAWVNQTASPPSEIPTKRMA